MGGAPYGLIQSMGKLQNQVNALNSHMIQAMVHGMSAMRVQPIHVEGEPSYLLLTAISPRDLLKPPAPLTSLYVGVDWGSEPAFTAPWVPAGPR